MAPLLALALSLAACGGGGSDAGPAIGEADREQAERDHPELLAEFGGAYAGEEAAYLAQIGDKVADAAGVGGQCKFTLVNSDVVNAFAVPGCYIYVTRGLMGIVGSEGELASVLAHEVGHITGNHGAEQQRGSVLRAIGVIAVGALTGSDRLTDLAGKAAGFFDLRYSRKHEYEADELGLTYLRKAGYDPYAEVDMLERLQAHQRFQDSGRSEADARAIPEWQLTHPLTENRVERARDLAKKTGLKEDALPEHEARYLGHLDGLLYGDDPEQGFVLGRRFLHPVMRIGFEAPTGYELTNSPQAIMIEGPEGTRGQFAGGPMPRGGLREYADRLLSAMLGDAPVDIVSTQAGRANGVPALIVQAQVRTQEGAVPVSLAVYDGGAGIDGQPSVYHFLMVSQPGAPPQAELASLFNSFRLLSPQDVAGLRPRYLRLWTVQPGETVQSLSARMAGERQVDLFRMLNGLGAKDGVKPGQQVKLVGLAAN